MEVHDDLLIYTTGYNDALCDFRSKLLSVLVTKMQTVIGSKEVFLVIKSKTYSMV